MSNQSPSPVYNIRAVPIEKIRANSWNPNHVPPPEFRLLELSIRQDGYTMPIVCYYQPDDDQYEIVDGYHRWLVMKRNRDIYDREGGCLPVSVIDGPESDRVASTIRHNRARGEHNILRMSDILSDLSDSGMSRTWIAKNLGMDADEVMRLLQAGGAAAAFGKGEFGKAWEPE